jgi:hypothetical protein
MYFAQVLERNIVNALVIIDLIPTRRHLVRSPEECPSTVDEFMSHHFESTMGRLIRDLRSITTVPGDLEQLLRDALKKRNWLARDFFREPSLDFMTTAGRALMLREVGECRDLFEAADERLEAIVHPLRVAAVRLLGWRVARVSSSRHPIVLALELAGTYCLRGLSARYVRRRTRDHAGLTNVPRTETEFSRA